jgi:hypothetical protein
MPAKFVHNTPWRKSEPEAFRDLVILTQEVAWFALDPHLRQVLEKCCCFGQWYYRFTIIAPEHAA